jgi:cytochrome d ubiquinol oxidase subunit II
MGGADFGAGVLELFFNNSDNSRFRKNAYHAIGPIWEANHMWLIIAVVILFVGFPEVFSTVCVFLHIPMLIMLLGIIARGTSFTFRHYDAVQDHWQAHYNRIFAWSSFITPLFLGIIAGSAVARTIDTESTSFVVSYIWSWLNWFSVLSGLFTVFLCGFLAAIYLLGEADSEELQNSYRRKANIMIFAMLGCAILIFVAAAKQSIPLQHWIFGNLTGWATVLPAAAALLILWSKINAGSFKNIRLFSGFIVTMLLISVTYAHFPNIILLKNGHDLSLTDQNTPTKTIHVLGQALIWGSLLILPSLVYLVYSFHKKEAFPVTKEKPE